MILTLLHHSNIGSTMTRYIHKPCVAVVFFTDLVLRQWSPPHVAAIVQIVDELLCSDSISECLSFPPPCKTVVLHGQYLGVQSVPESIHPLLTLPSISPVTSITTSPA